MSSRYPVAQTIASTRSTAAVGEGHLVRRATDAMAGRQLMLPVAHLVEVVLAQRVAGDEEVRVRLGRAEVGRVAGDAQHPLAQQRAVARPAASTARRSAPTCVYHCQSDDDAVATFFCST